MNLVDKTKEIRQEKQRTDSLLRQMLPVEIVDQLKQQKTTAAEYFECVTIFFSDVLGFSDYCSRYSPIHVVELLNSLYRLFDDVITHYDVYKVETINDSYMVSSGKSFFEPCSYYLFSFYCAHNVRIKEVYCKEHFYKYLLASLSSRSSLNFGDTTAFGEAVFVGSLECRMLNPFHF